LNLTEAERSVKIVALVETAKTVAQEEHPVRETPVVLHDGGITQNKGTDPVVVFQPVNAEPDAKDREEQFCAKLARNPQGGRPPEPGSYRDVEQRTGIPESTIRRAEQHVAAMLIGTHLCRWRKNHPTQVSKLAEEK